MVFQDAFSKPSGTAVLDFGSGAVSATLVVLVPDIGASSQVILNLSSVPTAEHSLDDLLIDPIRLMAYSVLDGVGFTIYGQMDNAKANGTYNINWYTR